MTASKLTKSKFRLACECPTKLYYVDKPQYANQLMEDSFLKALAEGGYQVEALARCYFPEGIFVAAQNKSNLEETKRLLEMSLLRFLKQKYSIRDI